MRYERGTAVAEDLRRGTGTVMIPPWIDLKFGRVRVSLPAIFFVFMLPFSNTLFRRRRRHKL